MRTAIVVVLAAGAAARAQISCGRPGPDLIISDITGTNNYAAVGGLDAFAVGTRNTDVGLAQVNYFNTSSGHPVLARGLFRMRTVSGAARFEQIGQAWAFHDFCPLTQGTPCGCIVPFPNDCTHLGVGCSTVDAGPQSGSQSLLGPKWQVNPFTGTFPYPPANPPLPTAIARRLQARLTDLNLVDQFFVEATAIAADDAAAGNGNNNASYRPATFTGAASDYTIALAGSAVPEQPAIAAWKAADPLVTESRVQMPGGGLVILSSRATPIAGGWHYEFALYNLNCDAGIGAISVGAGGVAPSNLGFHDVDYTDGDGEGSVTRDGTDWPGAYSAGSQSIFWQTTPYATNPNANALLFGTLYNFRFDSTRPPMAGTMLVSQWRTFGVVQIPAQTPLPNCYPNCDGSTTAPILNVQDFACFLNAFAAGQTYANCDLSSTPPTLNVSDFSCFLNAFAAGCF